MSAQTCPRCGGRGFTWSTSGEAGSLTLWHCSLCRYVAEEDESRQSRCPTCGDNNLSLLTGGGSSYRFCFTCQTRQS